MRVHRWPTRERTVGQLKALPFWCMISFSFENEKHFFSIFFFFFCIWMAIITWRRRWTRLFSSLFACILNDLFIFEERVPKPCHFFLFAIEQMWQPLSFPIFFPLLLKERLFFICKKVIFFLRTKCMHKVAKYTDFCHHW